jgi:signal transduction histidine kinase
MSHLSPRSNDPRLSLGVSLVLCICLAAVVCWWRLFVYRYAAVGVGYSLPILLVGWTRRRNLLWGMCGVFVVMAFIKVDINHGVSTMPFARQVVSFSMLMIDLLVLTGVVDLVLRREEALRAGGQELFRRQQELKMSNEGSVERQQRLEVLLALSRSLTVGQSQSDVFAAIARTIHQLLGETPAIGLWERRDQSLEMVAQEGFGKNGPGATTAALEGSFAGKVIQDQKCLAISSMASQPGIHEERMLEGPVFQAMLGAPLKAVADVAAALVVYSPQARRWTESDLSLIESLAAQASVSIAATRLVERVENEHAQMQTIVEAVPFCILRTNVGATRLFCNPAAAALLGFPESIEADSEHWPQMTLVGPRGEIPLAGSPLLRALRGEVTAAMEFELNLAQHGAMTVLCNAAPIRDTAGAITGAISAFVDITALKSMRDELVNTRRLAEEASSLRGRFLSAVSHDVRTPANAISLLAELLKKIIGDPAQAEEVPEICTEIERCSTSLVNLVTDVLDLIRLDIGRLAVNETEFVLGPWLRELCNNFETLARQKSLEFSVNISCPDARLRTDKVKLGRILTNLVTNAVKFTETGQVRLEANLLADRTLQFRIVDTGIGIAPENIMLIFDEFAQLKSSQRAKTGGSGMGLAITRRLVQLLGGKLEVVSEAGKGSTFAFCLQASTVIG